MKEKAKHLCLTLCMFFFTVSAFAQQRTVKGTVIDDSGTPLANVSYVIKGTQTGGMTDDEGNFSVSVPGNNAVLVFSEVNHQTQEVKVGSQSELTVVMSALSGSLQEVVVTAMGIKRQEKSLGYATSTVQSGDIVKTAPTNFAAALYGKVPGLQVSSSPGGSMSGVAMQLRGVNSINFNSSPLIILEGPHQRRWVQ